MTPREYLDSFREDPRLTTGGYFDQAPLAARPGETIGVVLMNHGGPMEASDVEPFLYNRLMDPVAVRLPIPTILRDRFARVFAKRRARQLRRAYEMVGGISPVVRHSREQAVALERQLNETYGSELGVTFRTFVAMRYGLPTCAQAAQQMAEEGVDRIVLLPLHPHFATTTTGTSLAFWKAMEAKGEVMARPTSFVYEYAGHPKYIKALSERIDEGLQRFPQSLRGRVQIVFAAHGAPLQALKQGRDPYCCLVHSTVQQVVDHRDDIDPDHGLHVSFHEVGVPGRGLGPSTRNVVDGLADEGHEAVLVVPVTFTSDHVETAYGLDVVQRARAITAGIEHYEVASGLNCHPLFIEALAEAAVGQVRVEHPTAAGPRLPLPMAALPRLNPECRSVRCQWCSHIREAADWGESRVGGQKELVA